MALQNPSSTLTEIVTTTLRNRTGKLADNITKNNALLFRLRKRGNVKTVSGGRTIVQELEYAENGTFKRYSGYEALNISPSDVFTGAEFNYAQAAVAVSISGLEQLQNTGEEAIIDLLESRIKNAEKTLVNNIALDCYSDGTAPDIDISLDKSRPWWGEGSNPARRHHAVMSCLAARLAFSCSMAARRSLALSGVRPGREALIALGKLYCFPGSLGQSIKLLLAELG
jgi:hypothetical protein